MFFFQNLVDDISLELSLLGSHSHTSSPDDKPVSSNFNGCAFSSGGVFWVVPKDVYTEFQTKFGVETLTSKLVRAINDTICDMHKVGDDYYAIASERYSEDDRIKIKLLLALGFTNVLKMVDGLKLYEQYPSFEDLKHDHPEYTIDDYKKFTIISEEISKRESELEDEEPAVVFEEVPLEEETPKEDSENTKIDALVDHMINGVKFVSGKNDIPEETELAVKEAALKMYEDCGDSVLDKYDDNDLQVIEVLIAEGIKDPVTVYKTVNTCVPYRFDVDILGDKYPDIPLSQYKRAYHAVNVYHKWMNENPQKVVHPANPSTHQEGLVKPFEINDEDLAVVANAVKTFIDDAKKEADKKEPKSTSKTKSAATKKETKSATKKTDKAAAPTPVPAV